MDLGEVIAEWSSCGLWVVKWVTAYLATNLFGRVQILRQNSKLHADVKIAKNINKLFSQWLVDLERQCWANGSIREQNA